MRVGANSIVWYPTTTTSTPLCFSSTLVPSRFVWFLIQIFPCAPVKPIQTPADSNAPKMLKRKSDEGAHYYPNPNRQKTE